MGKKRFFANHAKSSAMVVSLAIHAILIVAALSFVAVKVIVKEEPAFVEKRAKRPKMPPKKIQVPVKTKKKPKPRLRKRIVTERKVADIKMPEISGIKGGLGNMGGDGLGSLGFDLDIGDLFGSNKSLGNELTGTFYDLKQTSDGKPSKLATSTSKNELYYGTLARFLKGWDLDRLDKFFQAPKQKYTTFFMIPMDLSSRATEAFGVGDMVTPNYWAAYYEGNISAPETGRYRFHGYGDNVLIVRVGKRLVLDASLDTIALQTGWTSDADNDRKHPIGKKRDLLYIGDWFRLTKGESVRIEVLIGDDGGECSAHLLIEQKGKEYKQAPYSYTIEEKKFSGTRPVLPIFKTKEIPSELHGKMKVDPKEVTLDGPSFGAVK